MTIRPIETGQQIAARIAANPWGSLAGLITDHGAVPLSEDVRADLLALDALGFMYEQLGFEAALSGDVEAHGDMLSGAVRVAIARHRLQPHASLADLASISQEVH